MDLPGEKLVSRLWETVADKAIGSLFKPWQIRREGKAKTDVRREETLVIAQAEHDATEIRSGKARLLPDGRVATVLAETRDGPVRIGSSAEREPPSVAQLVSGAVVADAIRKEVNTSKALVNAEAELADDPAEPPADKVDEDWLFRWRDAASAVSADELQHLWGRVLAGEVKSPGSFSLRTMEFLRNISQSEAQSIERLSTVALNDSIYRDETALAAAGIDFQLLLAMQDLGLMSGVDALGLDLTMTTLDQNSFKQVLLTRDRALIITHPEQAKQLKIPVYGVSSIGVQVMRLGTQESNLEYLQSIGKKLCEQGFTVSLARYMRIGERQIRYFDARPVCVPPSPVQ